MTGRAHKLGEAIFVTSDGLTAEGNGWLSSIGDHIAVVEFRNSEGNVDHLPPRGSIAFFASEIQVEAETVMLLGAVTRAKDAMGRQGFFGVCQAVNPGEYSAENYGALMELFNAGHKHYRDEFRHARHRDKIGFIKHATDDNHRLRPTNASGAFSVFVRGDEPHEQSVVLRLWQFVEETHQTTLLWNCLDGPFETLTENVADKEAKRLLRELKEEETLRRNIKQQALLSQRYDMSAEAGFAEARQSYDAGGYSPEQQAKFDARGRLLEYRRPANITIEHEEYLIGLIRLVMAEDTGSRQRSGGQLVERITAAAHQQDFAIPFAGTSKRKIDDLLVANLPTIVAALFGIVLAIFAVVAVVSFSGGGPSEQADVPPQSQSGVQDN